MPQTGRHCPMLRITGHVAVVRLLLELKADVNTKDGHEKTALSWAAQNGHKAVVRLLARAQGGRRRKELQRDGAVRGGPE
jgi:ankyrin repeat protein